MTWPQKDGFWNELQTRYTSWPDKKDGAEGRQGTVPHERQFRGRLFKVFCRNSDKEDQALQFLCV